MVQNNQLNEETIDKLVIIFKKVVKEITDSLRKNNVQENLQAVQNLSQQKAEQEKMYCCRNRCVCWRSSTS